MEWVETTGKSIDEAKEKALDQLGVADDDAEFEIVEEPRTGLFGIPRGEARLRARVRPTEVRPKQERRRGKRSGGGGASGNGAVNEESGGADAGGDSDAEEATVADEATAQEQRGDQTAGAAGGSRSNAGEKPARRPSRPRSGGSSSNDSEPNGDDDRPPVEPAVVGAAAVGFIEGLVSAFGMEADVTLTVDDIDLEVRADGGDLGLLIGPGGRTLLAVQDIARVSAQRRLGDHETRLRIDVAGYRERRRVALERFAHSVADQVLETGGARAMEPMPSADRKVIHDVLATVEGVTSHSEGDDPSRRVVVTPA